MNGLYTIVFSACCILSTVHGTDPTDSGTLSSRLTTTLENSVPTSKPDEQPTTTNLPTLEGSTQKMTPQVQGMTTNMFGTTKLSQEGAKSSVPTTETTESAINMGPKIPALAKSMEGSTYSTNNDIDTSTEAGIPTSTTSPTKGPLSSNSPDQVASTQKSGAEEGTTKPAMETSPVLLEVQTTTQPATTKPPTTTEANVPITPNNPIQKIPTTKKTSQVQSTTTTTMKPTNQSPDDEKSLASPIKTSILLIVIPTILFSI